MSFEGDLDHNGTLDQQDLAFLRQLICDNPEILNQLSDQEKACLDINHDGQINYDDIVALCGKIIQKDEKLPLHTSDKLEHLRSKLRR